MVYFISCAVLRRENNILIVYVGFVIRTKEKLVGDHPVIGISLECSACLRICV